MKFFRFTAKTVAKVCFAVITFLCLHLFGGDNKYVVLSTVKARAIAMGGAFVSIEDDLASLNFNPASFSAKTLEDKVRFFVYTNGFAPVIAYFNRNNSLTFSDALGLLVKGVTLSANKVQFGVVFGEQSFNPNFPVNTANIFNASDYRYNRSTSFGVSVSFAPEVQVGVAGEVFTRKVGNKVISKIGYKYGLRLKTHSNITVGLCFVDFPNEFSDARMPLERIVDETLNVGFSYNPVKRVTFSVDVRNVSEERKDAVREPHLGFEVNVINHLTVRGGFFYQKEEKIFNYSAGLGIFNWNSMFSENRIFTHPQFLLDAAVVIQRQGGVNSYWYVAKFILRL